MRAYQLPKPGAGIESLAMVERPTPKPSQLKNVASADLQKRLLRQADYGKASKEFLNAK